MAKYKLLSDHVAPDGRIVPAGTVVEDWQPGPSNQMEGMDDEGKQKVKELHQQLYGTDGPQPTPEASEADKKAEEEERKTVEGEPVSEQQRREFEALKKDEPLPREAPRSPTVTASPTRGGQRPSPGTATPKTEPEDARPSRPNQDQYPKDA